jgi:glutaminyl-peptide cyclotransferase
MKQTAAAAVLFSCLVATTVCENWKLKKTSRLSDSAPLGDADVDYFANEIQNEVDFKKHLDNILIPRVPGTEGSNRVRQYIEDTLRQLGWDVEISSSTQKTPIGNLPFNNVIATLDPLAPRRLVLVCHYDSKRTPEGFLGATDSAVPCAQMLNLAYTMRRDLQEDKEKKPELTLQLLFLDGEEALQAWQGTDNTYGARDLAAKWQDLPFSYQGVNGNTLDRIDMFVLLDLIGAKNPTFLALQSSTLSWFERLVAIEGNLYNARALSKGRQQPMFIDPDRQKHLNAGVEDDHIPFERRGVPILHLICLPFPDVWHKIGDNESAVDYDSVSDLNKIFRVFVAEYLQLRK